MEALKLAVLLAIWKVVFCFDVIHTVSYFKQKDVRFATAFLCNKYDANTLSKNLATVGIRSNSPFPKLIEDASELWSWLYYPLSKMTGVVIDMKCDNAETVLQLASNNRFFDISRHWLIYTEKSFTVDEFEAASLAYEPQMFDIHEFLEFRNDKMKYSENVRRINFEVNVDILKDPAVLSMMEHRQAIREPTNDDDKLELYATLLVMVDSEVTLAIPDPETQDYNLYTIYRYTIFTRVLIEPIGKMVVTDIGKVLLITRNTSMEISSVIDRKHFNGTLIRSCAGLLHFDYLSKSTEVNPGIFDHFAMRHLQVSVLIEEKYNFRMVVKCFDEYGWLINGSYTGMLRDLSENRIDMTAGGMLLYTSRMDAITYIDNTLPVPIGLIFKAPALSQVANIFILPFSTTVWASALGISIVTGFLLFLQFRVIRNFRNQKLEDGVDVNEVFAFLTGAAFQQGTDVDTTNISARLTMLVFLVSSLFLFTSYTANIVSLLQTPSDSINSVRDFVDSALEMGFENLPYQEKLIEEDTDPLIRELDAKKLAEKRVKGEAYIDGSTGMEKVRKDLYAFHLELSTAGKIISESYLEGEKCRLKVINLFPNRYNGHAVPKQSSFYELLAQPFRWSVEAGFVDRANRRFTYSLPKCSGGGAGFNSIALSDVDEIVYLMVYGCIISCILLFMENLIYYCKHKQKREIKRHHTFAH